LGSHALCSVRNTEKSDGKSARTSMVRGAQGRKELKAGEILPLWERHDATALEGGMGCGAGSQRFGQRPL